jgi:hypothetical protein
MTPDDQTIETASEFNEQLRELLESAYRNDVEVEGGWDCRSSSSSPDWDVVVSEIEAAED